MQPVLMPQIGQDITVGRIVRWHKGAMEPVRQGEVILTVESEKASFEVEAERDGVLLEILHGEGEEAEVLSPVGYIGEPGESPPGAVGAARPRGAAAAGSPAAARPAPKAPAGETGGVGEDARAVPRTGPHRTGGEPFASPSARRVAAQRGIRLEDIPGTGPRGRIVKQDVLRAAAAAPAEHDTEIPFTGVRRVVAERLSLSSRTIPHFYLFQDIDMGAAFAFRETTNRREREHVTITALVAYAAIQALRRFPRLNAHVEEDRLVLKARIDLGVAVDSERGLVVPVIRSADSLGLGELAASLARVSSEARKSGSPPGAARSPCGRS
jgi:pyruvate dehydrogenase E2 component (dihydrolipoamide acetyltransferase)